MSCLKIYQDNYTDATVISNRFIDEYMREANDAQLKIYLYLIRIMNTSAPLNISDIADMFNHTEKDVMRALKYWEKLNVLSLEFDSDKSLIGIHLHDLSRKAQSEVLPMANIVPMASKPESRETVRQPVPAQADDSSHTVLKEAPPKTEPADKKADPVFVKPSYSIDELAAFKEKESTAQLLFIAEQYLCKTLSPSDMKSILFFSDVLHFTDDLIDYLLQYCVERGKKDFRYIEKVAVSWAEEGISNPADAEAHAGRYDRSVYQIMNALGKSGVPTRKEVEFIRIWREGYAFETDIIIEACERTVLATDKHRFEYADKILNSWKKEGVRHKADIARLDAGHQKEQKDKAPAPSGRSVDRYNRFMQNSYDYEALEQELLRN